MEQPSIEILQDALQEYQEADAEAGPEFIPQGLLERAQALLNVREDVQTAMKSLSYQELLKSIDAARGCGEIPENLTRSEAVLTTFNALRCRIPRRVSEALQRCRELEVQADMIEKMKEELEQLEGAYAEAARVQKEAIAVMKKLKYDYESKAFLCSIMWNSDAELMIKLKGIVSTEGLPAQTSSIRDDGFVVDRAKSRAGSMNYDISGSKALDVRLENISSTPTLQDGAYTVNVMCTSGKESCAFSLLLKMGETLWWSGDIQVGSRAPHNATQVLFFVVENGIICFDRELEDSPSAALKGNTKKPRKKTDDSMSEMSELSSAISSLSSKPISALSSKK